MTRGRRARLLAGVLLLAWSAFMVRMTLWPHFAHHRADQALNSVITAVSGHKAHQSFVHGRWEHLGNVALFIPYAVLLRLVGLRTWMVIAVSAVTSGAIELAQKLWLPDRVSSLSDVVDNVAGALIGVALMAAIYKVQDRRRT